MSLHIFDGFTLKMIMVVLMVFDHIAQFIPGTPYWFHWLGRLVAPIFFYLLIEGYHHTRNRLAYMKRLFTWAGIMFVGNVIVSLLFKRDFFITNNIFFSMALGIALLLAIEKSKESPGEKEVKNTLLIIAILFFSSFAEGSILSVAMVLIFYYLRKDKVKMSLSYIAISAIFLSSPQWMMVFALPFMLMYNEKRGKDIKYFFYVFYPIHIWLLYTIGYFIEK